MYEKPLIHRGDTLGARASPYAPAGYSMLGLFGGGCHFLPEGALAVSLGAARCSSRWSCLGEPYRGHT